MNVVTKSGTNTVQGSFFELFRDKAMNVADADREARRTRTSRTTAAISSAAASAGRSRRTRRTSSPRSSGRSRTRSRRSTPRACSRTRRHLPVAYRENLATGKVTANLTPAQYLSVRYGRNNNTQPYGASPEQHRTTGATARTS